MLASNILHWELHQTIPKHFTLERIALQKIIDAIAVDALWCIWWELHDHSFHFLVSSQFSYFFMPSLNAWHGCFASFVREKEKAKCVYLLTKGENRVLSNSRCIGEEHLFFQIWQKNIFLPVISTAFVVKTSVERIEHQVKLSSLEIDSRIDWTLLQHDGSSFLSNRSSIIAEGNTYHYDGIQRVFLEFLDLI